jgi:hypothetical protein
MDPLTGLPDFGKTLTADDTVAFAAFGGGPWSVLPAMGPVTDLQLTMIRRADDLSAAGSYAMLDVEVGCDYPLDKALELARAADPSATVAATPIELGFARLIPAGKTVALSDAMTAPIPLGWARSGGARWTDRLDLSTAELIKSALQGGSLLFGVRIEFSLSGVAPRTAAQVSFVPAALMPQLLGGAGGTFLAREDLVTRLSDQALSPALQTDAMRADVADALADRLLATFGQFAPAAGALDFGGFAFSGPLPTERLDWDLSQPAAAMRAFVIRLDTVSGLAALDPASMVRELTIPPLDLGFRDVVLAANLPAPRIGAPAIGVRLSAPPAPPNRPSGINQTVTFSPPDDAGRATLRFDPSETFAYDLTPFALFAASGLVREIDAPPRPSNNNFVQLQASDFGLLFTHITASARLVAAATISGNLAYAFGGSEASISVKLDAATSDIALAMPAGATGASLTFTATATDGAVTRLPAVAPGRIQLDFASFPTYGPRRLALHCHFLGEEPPLTLELEPENGVGAASVALAPSAPDASWGYFAASPFHAGYRFRPAGGTWSDTLDPGVPLNLTPEGVILNPAPTPTTPHAPAPFELNGVGLAPDPNTPGVLRYVPATPTPELDTSGRPTLMILKMPQAVSLQFGVHFDLPAGGEAALAAQLAKAKPDLASETLQPAMLTVQHIGVKLADATGANTEIASSAGSGFPPYAAVFSIPLTEAQGAQAISAVGGRSGILSVEYTVDLPGAETPLVKSVDVATWFAGTSGLDHVRALG